MKPSLPRHSSRLALALLAMPCGVFAAYNHTSTLTNASTLSPNLVTIDTLAATGLDTVGTAAAPNTNYIGWAIAPTTNVNLYWSTSGLTTSELLTRNTLSIGGSVTATSSASSSYNSLTIGDCIELIATDLAVGTGVLASGELAKTVDATKPANGNSLTVTGASYYPAQENYLRTILAIDGVCDVGHYGNDNSVSVTHGGYLSVNGIITLGASDENNPTFGCGNNITITGQVKSDIIGGSIPAKSTVAALGLIVGDYGSDNAATVSDNATLSLPGAITSLIKVGVRGDRNTLTVTDGAALLKGNCTVGEMPSANDNRITLSNSYLQNPLASAFTGLFVGVYGQANSFEMTDSTLKTDILRIGYGDDSGGDDALDETSGYEVGEGSHNSFRATDSTILLKNTSSFTVGLFGSWNEATITGSGICSAWTDASSTEYPDGDGKVQFSEITAGISSIVVGQGRNDSDIENSIVFGGSNSLTLSDTAVVTDTLNVGYFGSVNILTLTDGSLLHVKQAVTMGEGSVDNFECGMGNTIIAYDAGTEVKVDGGLNLGHFGSSNAFVIVDGADAVIKGGMTVGKGLTFSADIDNSRSGASNLLGVLGAGSTVSIESDDTIYIGDYGSSNRLLVHDEAECTIDADNIILGNAAVELGTILNSNKVYSEYNRLSISNATLRTTALVTVGNLGRNNGLSVYGGKAYAELGGLVIGQGNTNDPTFGAGNEVRVRDKAVLVTGYLKVGSQGNTLASDNLLQVIDEAVVVVNGVLAVNNTKGSNNRIAVRNGIIALKGKGPASDVTWEDVLFNGYSSFGDTAGETSLVDAGAILVWNFTSGDFVTATKSDISLHYYSTEAEAKEETGYEGLAGYTILKQANDLSRLAWAGDVYDGGNGSYCSSWYGWFYNDAAYGDYIMSYNNNSWQYVDPSSTEENAWFYDYSLNTWFYTDMEHFQDHWIYNCTTSVWQKLYE